MEEQHERENPINPKKTLGTRRGRTTLVAPDVEYSGGGATPSMGLSQFRGGRTRKSEEHMMGRALKKHLLGLHGAGFYKGFSDGFLDSDSESDEEYVGGKAWNTREHTAEENAEHEREAMEAYNKRVTPAMRREAEARAKMLEKEQAEKRKAYLESEQGKEDMATKNMTKAERRKYQRDKYEEKHPFDKFARQLGEGAEDVIKKIAPKAGEFLGYLDPAGVSETLTGKKLSEHITKGIENIPKGSVALGEKIAKGVGLGRKRKGKGKLVITHGGAKTGRYEGLGSMEGCGTTKGEERKTARRAYEGSGLQKRNLAVKKVMAEKGMSMIDASKWVKEHGY
jgi:hypothetical protein